MKRYLTAFILCSLALAEVAYAGRHLDFTLHKLESGQAGRTLLVVGGIQGDEPGSFNAASLLTTHYKIRKGSVWIVPNLNFISIVKRSRGVHGDLNRKFAYIKRNDPEYETIKKIKSIILDDEVDLVLNLHDGSGFYRPRYLDRMRNPRRWGQSIIIDQEKIAGEEFGDLAGVAKKVVARVNRHLRRKEHVYHIKNTKTRDGNREMARTLTYFAIRNLKPAFGVEVSKKFRTYERVYYHLQVIESYMNLLGIAYERRFDLAWSGIKKAIETNRKLAFYDNRIFLDVGNVRKILRYFPLKKGAQIMFTPSNPLITVISHGKHFKVYHGNRMLTRLYSQYFYYDSSIHGITMLVDGETKDVNFGEIVDVTKAFKVVPKKGYRVNVIGFKKPGIANESGIDIRRNDIMKRFSVDKRGRSFRVEVYSKSKNKFSGMVLVNFPGKPKKIIALTPSRFPESNPMLGR